MEKMQGDSGPVVQTQALRRYIECFWFAGSAFMHHRIPGCGTPIANEFIIPQNHGVNGKVYLAVGKNFPLIE